MEQMQHFAKTGNLARIPNVLVVLRMLSPKSIAALNWTVLLALLIKWLLLNVDGVIQLQHAPQEACMDHQQPLVILGFGIPAPLQVI